MPIKQSYHCPACGYDQRGISSDRCPECGTAINRLDGRFIPWQERSTIGYLQAFSRTLFRVSLNPLSIAPAVQRPVDVRSARLFRWIIRALIILPCVAVYLLAWSRTDIPKAILPADGPGDSSKPAMSFWEPRFLWAAGASMLPALPIGFAIAVSLATGITPWFYRRRFEPVQSNRAMALSHYLIAPLGFVILPCIPAAVLVYLSTFLDSQVPNVVGVCFSIGFGISIFLILLAMLNQLRAVSEITQRGPLATMAFGVGILMQALIAAAIGLGLFPLIWGLLRIIAGTMWH